MAFAPILIIGVPRSGTTLLRVLLDSHSQILALPETPWLSGAYGNPGSLRHLLDDLTDGPFGVVKNVSGVEREHVRAAGASLLEQLFEPALKARGKSVVAFKTPSDIPRLGFLTWLMPDARYIHITRDGRDVAMSQMAKRGSFFHELRGYSRFSYANVFKRWREWESHVRATLYGDGRKVVHLRYEDLIADPEREMRRVLAFLELPFEPAMLDYAGKKHDYPGWEAGSTDVSDHGGISKKSVGKWRGAQTDVEVLHTLMKNDAFLVELGYPSSEVNPGPGRKLMVAGYSLFQPAAEILAVAQRPLRAFMRDGLRMFALFALVALAAVFLAPATLPGMTSPIIEPLFSFGATLATALAFLPALQRRSGTVPAFVRIAEVMFIILAVLEMGQYFVADHSASLADLLVNACGAAAALLAAAPVVLRSRDRIKSA